MNNTNHIQDAPLASEMPPWWRGAVVYQVYPRSLMDSTGDGVGDLPGITQRLDYIASLGVDAVWVSPFFKSPMKDFGYDVSDFRAVDPLFGELGDFDRLVAAAHAQDLKVLIDLVPSHTSDEHPWFQDSRARRDGRDDWYVWADASDDGGPPNNWLSVFGGSAWEWDAQRSQYYLHNFLASQPDLNFHCVAVQDQILDELTFWLRRGVDGFRLDAVNYCFHDAQLRDNPLKPKEERKGRGFSPDNPYAWQYHRYDNTQPENLKFLTRVRRLLDQYPGTVALGEINSDDSNATIAEYTNGNDRLHMGYSFELLADECSPAFIRDTVADLESRLESGWPCWAISNHDVVRVATRWATDGASPARARLFTAMVCSLRGTICTYQGEELGLTQAEIARDQLQDPFGINFWPSFKGRDGCRTPMPWHNREPGAGFSSGDPWLPIPEQHRARSVAQQEDDEQSVLNHYRRFLSWRKNQPALMWGSQEFVDTPTSVLGFVREYGDQRLLVLMNFAGEPVEVPLPAPWRLTRVGSRSGQTIRGSVVLKAFEPWFGDLALDAVFAGGRGDTLPDSEARQELTP
ncbi:MAG: alpha-glucosidase family protein [Pseudomonadota bacterium]